MDILLSVFLYSARMLLGLLIVVNAYKKNLTRVFSYLCGIILPPYLVNGGICRMIIFQLDNKCRFVHAAGNHHEVGIALARSVLTMDNIFVLGPDFL